MGEIIGKGALALLPIIWLIVALTGLKMAGHKGLRGSADHHHRGVPVHLENACGGLRDLCTGGICLCAVAHHPGHHRAIFTYNLSLKTGAMDVITDAYRCFRRQAGSGAPHRVVLWGALWRGMAGFGTAIATGQHAGRHGDEPHYRLPCVYAGQRSSHGLRLCGYSHRNAGQCDRAGPAALAFTTVVQMIPFMILVPFLMVIVGAAASRRSRVWSASRWSPASLLSFRS